MQISVDSADALKMCDKFADFITKRTSEFKREFFNKFRDTYAMEYRNCTLDDERYHVLEEGGFTDCQFTEQGWTSDITITGTHILFVEFGTGITYNGQSTTVGDRTEFMGSYGKGYGRNDFWMFQKNRKSIATYGTRSQAPAYLSFIYTENHLDEIIGKAFK